MAAWVETLVNYAKGGLDERVREALWTRGASEDQIDLLQIGYLNKELPPAEYPADFLEWCWHGRKLADSFVFPLTNPLGEVLGFQFRGVERSSTYSDYFLTRAEPVYFGLGQAMPSIWEHEAIMPVEGVFDYFPTQRVVPYSVSTLTAKVSGNLLRACRRIVKRWRFFYDNDAIGIRVYSAFVKEYGGQFEEVRSVGYPIGVKLPNGKAIKDPGDLWEAWGDDRFKSFLQAQME